jgi:hypothetical protein
MADQENSDALAYRIFKVTMISTVLFVGFSGAIILSSFEW